VCACVLRCWPILSVRPRVSSPHASTCLQELREFLEAEAESARERMMVNAILHKIAQEDAAEAAQRARVRAELVSVIEQFKAQRERQLESQRAAEREEEARIRSYMAAQASRDEDAKRAKAEDFAAREAKYRAIVAEQDALRRKQEEEDALRWLLVEAEAEKRRIEAERKRKVDAERSRREMLVANEEQRRCVLRSLALQLCPVVIVAVCDVAGPLAAGVAVAVVAPAVLEAEPVD